MKKFLFLDSLVVFSCIGFLVGGIFLDLSFFFLWNVDNKENFFILVKDGC